MQAYWLEQTVADVPATNHWLGENELQCLNALRFLKRRTEWRLGRWTAKRAVSAYLDLPCHADELAAVEILSANSGAPEVFVGGRPATLTISLSHRADRALCVVMSHGAKLGCDLELIESRGAIFLSDYFSVEEQNLIARAPAAEQDRLSTLVWSAKESALKALQAGLRLPTASVVVTLDDTRARLHGWNPFQVRHAEGRLFHGWWRQDANFIRTLVTDSPSESPMDLCLADEARTSDCASLTLT